MITFQCQAYGEINYFNEVALSLLSLMGHSGSVPGAFKADEVSEALSKLQRGLGQQTDTGSLSSEEDAPQIDLAKRAIPLIDLLRAAVKDHCDVLWR